MSRRTGKPTQVAPDDLFDSLVLNAIEFLQRAVEEVEQDPKHSVIDFCTALELFLKARLLREHWALVVAKVDDTTLQAFRNGDFQSVTVDKCLQRLRNITNESLLPHEQDCFEKLRNHRNKLVHFFHPDYKPPIAPTILQGVVSEQYKAWFYLHRLLTSQWARFFAPYTKEITALEASLRRNRQFLASKFKAQEPEIIAAQKAGATFHSCGICGFQAAKVLAIHEPLFRRQCVVCGWGSNFLELNCPQCGKPAFVEAEDGGECEHCETHIGIDYLFDQLGPDEDPKEETSIAYCTSCQEFDPTAVPFGDEDHLCLNCLELHTEVGQCGWCGDLITEDTSGTSVWGCSRCGGPDLKD
jgi:hypothetical protein